MLDPCVPSEGPLVLETLGRAACMLTSDSVFLSTSHCILLLHLNQAQGSPPPESLPRLTQATSTRHCISKLAILFNNNNNNNDYNSSSYLLSILKARFCASP